MNNNNELFNEIEDFRRRRSCNRVCYGPTGPTGATGEIGPTGPTGAAPTLTIGIITTGAPGTEAAATITGTSPNFVLNLTIPQGPTGPAA